MMSTDPTVYTVTLDDDPMISKMIEKATGIASQGFTTRKALTARLEKLEPVAVFVDMHLGPGDNGLDLVPTLRTRWPFCPILVVTADSADAAIGEALAAGANDFIRKPINKTEVVARLKARIDEMARHRQTEQVEIGDVVFNRRHKTLSGGGTKRHLTPKEALLFESVALAKGMLIERKELKRKVWGDTKVSDNAFDKLLHKVRSALRDVTSELSIVAIYGTGIALKTAAQAEEANA